MTPGQVAYQAGHIHAPYPSLWEWDKESASNQQEYEVIAQAILDAQAQGNDPAAAGFHAAWRYKTFTEREDLWARSELKDKYHRMAQAVLKEIDA